MKYGGGKEQYNILRIWHPRNPFLWLAKVVASDNVCLTQHDN